MDLLWNAYSNASDDEEEQPKRQRLSLSSTDPPKRHLPSPSPSLFDLQSQPPIPGSYISKRQRALMGSTPAPLPDPVPVPSPFTLSVIGARFWWSLEESSAEQRQGLAFAGRMNEQPTDNTVFCPIIEIAAAKIMNGLKRDATPVPGSKTILPYAVEAWQWCY
ncbi:unnamed protein product [Sphenostylis stenocarpa]|uniref:Uncharacterized protein n=1 Tax=Sphenostylis stenocarpa TaxID=92480 RepID=A0AA87B8F7_9FABA|nr:unnamed protein product [Sphenostylis stenocarpa]